ncbi:alpha/beta fold hydrolase [Gordonia sp. TBRC 11910]|uniref:Alpha/beta fold hydrolase n=1 Tax=Gordonia asplenii TaxID=2725283 RepID=A0A848KZS6_9ACTN|nr:AMP-binding protein [Gordonia asplenii]NMO03722.1 alpha/beta fold hydrolase [Gordonia asplenii]
MSTDDHPGDSGPLAKLGHAARTAANVVEYVRFGGLETGEEPSPFDIVMRTPLLSLRRYFGGADAASRTPVLLVPPLMLSADVWDVSPSTSAVALLHRVGLDPWVVDFGDPAAEPGGRQRNVTDHVLAVSDAITKVREVTGEDVHIGGYSQGGLFCYQAAALRRTDGVASIFALGSPMEPLSLPGVDLPEEVFAAISRFGIDVLSKTGLPGWAAANLFSWTSPVATAKQRVQYLTALGDREALMPRERQRRFLAGEGWITFPGPAIAEVMESMTNERFVRGGLVFDGRAVTLADITCPVLIFTGQYDAFAPPRAVRDVVKGLPFAQVWECSIPTGHFGLGVGSRANRETWPTVTRWIGWVGGEGERPANIVDARSVGVEHSAAPSVGAWRQVVNLSTAGALAAPGFAKGILDRVGGTVSDLASEAIDQVPRLMRLERVGPATTVSYGGLLAESHRRDPDAVCLLYRGHAYTREDIRREIDDLVLRLLHVGVRRGEHVGVLVSSGAVLLSSAAALSRIGAVAVLLRPDSDTATEIRLGRTRRVVVDAENLYAVDGTGVAVHLLGETSEDACGATELSAVDVDRVRVPGWYRPNPGRGRDLGFVVFGDSADGIRALPVTNSKWALSAYGAASAAALTEADTVYAANPLYHASGLLLATAAPVAAGARLALTDRFDPQRFWTDVRQYGATVVPYTWSMLSLLVAQPRRAEEEHHPVRLFVGSGMPVSLWHSVVDRYAPAKVLEFFAPVRTDAIIADVSGRKIGSVGRPLSGTARTELAAIDPITGQVRHDADGYVVRATQSAPGRLLVAADRGRPEWEDAPMRGVFGPHDAWIDTGEVFRADADGDLWPMGRVRDVVARGRIRPIQIEDALSSLPSVVMVVVVDVAASGPMVAAVWMADGATLDVARARTVLRELSAAAGEVTVVAVDDIPLTRWYRPDIAALRREIVSRLEGDNQSIHSVW